MRERVDTERIRAFLRELGRRARVPGRIYLDGRRDGVLEGWRTSTIAIDLRFEPDDDALLRALPELKERLDINIELASPPDFIPELLGWRDRSPFVLREGGLEVHHFDPYSQALSKVERGFEHDLEDVQAMIDAGRVEPLVALALFDRIESDLYRYPAIDPTAVRDEGQAGVRRTLIPGAIGSDGTSSANVWSCAQHERRVVMRWESHHDAVHAARRVRPTERRSARTRGRRCPT